MTHKLSEIACSTKGKKPKSVSKEKTGGFEIPYVDIKAFEKGIVDNYTDGENCTFCKPDDVLIVWDGARCGFVGRGVEGAIGSTLAKISSEKYTNDFLFYFLQSKYKVLNSNPRGVGIPHIEPNLLWNFEVPEVDKSTQRLIVSRIETLFAELDKAVQHLRTAQQQLKTYRQAVLNHWLNNDDGKWEMVKLKDICLSISDGDHLPPKRTTQGIPFITISDIKGNCIDYSDVSYMTEEYYESLSDSRKAQIGDILYTVTGSFGIPVMVEDDKKFCFQRHIGLVRPNPNLAAQKWLYYMMQSPIIYSQANEKATGTAQKTVTLTVLRDFNLPLPPLAEQQRIVKEIESRLSQATASETYIENALQQAEALRQSILKKAFSGELE